MRMTAISIQKNCLATIWRKKKLDPCYLDPQKCSTQLFEATKKRMTAISSLKNLVHNTLEQEKRG